MISGAAIFSVWISAVTASVSLAGVWGSDSAPIFGLLPDISNVRQFLDYALHDMRRDKAGIECYATPPRFAKRRSNERLQCECGPGLWEETSGVITKNQNDRHREHLKRGIAPLILCSAETWE